MAKDNSAQEPTNTPVGNRDETASDSLETPATDPNRADAQPAVNDADKKL